MRRLKVLFRAREAATQIHRETEGFRRWVCGVFRLNTPSHSILSQLDENERVFEKEWNGESRIREGEHAGAKR